ncbi:MAG: hypothetical protein RIQ93_959 [Verrucomicrobiota bacterium]|jgi:TatD DNase family protein
MAVYFDAHNHLQDAWLQPVRTQVWKDLGTIPLRAAVVNGTAESDWGHVATLAEANEWSDPAGSMRFAVVPSYGLHPWQVGNRSAEWQKALRERVHGNVRAGIGEIGLDRWMLDRAPPGDPRLGGLRRALLEEQLEVFTWQLELATELNRPATIHCIDAWGALAQALRDTPPPRRGFLLHAYGGSIEMAREFAALGAYFSFNGYFLGDPQRAKRNVFQQLPADRILVETDAPAMPLPEARRKFTLPGLAEGNVINHPANIVAVYAGLAEVRGEPVESLAVQIEENFRRLFL